MLGLDASATRNGGKGAVASGSNLRLGFTASWEPDIWGQLRLAVTGAQASAEASAANLAAARLSAQAALATNYFALREADNEIALLTNAVTAYERSRQITQNQYDAGIAQRTDVLQAQTQLETTRANLSAAVGQRARLEHAIALLVGKAPAEFSVPVAPWNATRSRACRSSCPRHCCSGGRTSPQRSAPWPRRMRRSASSAPPISRTSG